MRGCFNHVTHVDRPFEQLNLPVSVGRIAIRVYYVVGTGSTHEGRIITPLQVLLVAALGDVHFDLFELGVFALSGSACRTGKVIESRTGSLRNLMGCQESFRSKSKVVSTTHATRAKGLFSHEHFNFLRSNGHRVGNCA